MEPQPGSERVESGGPVTVSPPPPPPPPPPRRRPVEPPAETVAAVPEPDVEPLATSEPLRPSSDAPVLPSEVPVAPLLPEVPVGVIAAVVDDEVVHEPVGFDTSVLRSEPPPSILPTTGLRVLLLLTQLVGIAVVVMVEYREGPDGLATSSIVVPPYLLAAVLLVTWSAFAMTNASRLVPATAYQRTSSPVVVVVLWLLAFAAPVAALRVIDWARDRFVDDADDTNVVIITVVVVMVAALLVWLPFRYHTVQAHRIGVPGRVVASWFWLPLVAGVGTLLIGSLGMSDMLREDGLTDVERAVQVGVVFGLPALVFAFATWRATAVFDEVIEIRWQRWSREWEDAVTALSGRPVPQPGGPVS